MNMQTNSISEERIREIAKSFQYPSTPDVAAAVMNRLESGSRPKVSLRSAWVVTGLLALVLAVLFAVPGVRAEIIRFFQVGVVRIFPSAPTSTAEPSLPQFPTTATPVAVIPEAAMPTSGVYEPQYTVTISDLAGETSLLNARISAPFPIRLPEYPDDLGRPDHVFLQEEGRMVILVWTDPAEPERARLSLHEIGPEGIQVSKYQPHVIQETQVNGKYAVWAQGPYLVELTSGSYVFRRTVAGNTLIWEEDEITYRLESDLPLEETLRIAESLR
jgi:hypothetical protein